MFNTVGVSDNVTVTIRLSSASCSVQATTTLYLEESEVFSLGTYSSTTVSVCYGDVPGEIQSTAVASASISGTLISYRWQQRADTSTSVWVNIQVYRFFNHIRVPFTTIRIYPLSKKRYNTCQWTKLHC